MWTRVCAFVAVLWWTTSPCAGQVVLTEAEALAKLSTDSPRVRAIRSSIDVAKAEALAAARWPNPRFAYDRETVSGITEDMTTVLQPLPISGRRSLEKRAASAVVDATTNRVADEVRRARADLRVAFAELVAAQTREQELTRARDRLRALADVLQKRQTAGDAAGFDRLRAVREVSELEADRVAAAADRVRAQAALASFFAPPGEPLAITVTSSSAPVQLPATDELFNHALTVRGESIALARDIEAAQWQHRAAARRVVPEPELSVGTKSSSVGGSAGSVVAVQLPIPLFDRGQPERAVAHAREMQAQARSEAFRLALRNQIEALRAIAIERRDEAERYRVAAGEADELARIAQISYDAGERGIFELLDAHRGIATTRVRQSMLDAAARQAEIELEFVSGWEIP